MRKIGVLIVIATMLITVVSCNTSGSYLTQNNKITKQETSLVALKSKLVKPIIMPDSINVLENQDDLLDRLEPVEFVSEVDIAISNIISEANSYLGTPYRYGGTTRRGIDCSAFMQKIFDVADIDLPRVSSSQAKVGILVDKDNLQKGDLIFFSTTSRYRITHVGMVVNVEDGNVEFIHAASSKGVSIASLSNTYWNRKYRFARRPEKLIEENILRHNNNNMFAFN